MQYVIIGHSERRQYFGETDETVAKRVRAALDSGLEVILCVGETLEQREADITGETIAIQVKKALAGVTAKELRHIIIAYEPVWAIGTGKTATDEQANEVNHMIRALLGKLYGEDAAEATTIQYGGSMNAKNAAGLLGAAGYRRRAHWRRFAEGAGFCGDSGSREQIKRGEAAMKKPLALIIMDGFGLRKETEGNAIAAAKHPTWIACGKPAPILKSELPGWMWDCRTARWAIVRWGTPIWARAHRLPGADPHYQVH